MKHGFGINWAVLWAASHGPDMAPTVSVIIPTYNRAHFITEAIASVQAQTFSDWELIVADDGSTDDTRQRLEAIAIREPRLRIISQQNTVLPGARNTALREARGQFVAF